VRLPNGKVLVYGGLSGNVVDIYDPATGSFTARQALFTHNGGSTLTLLNDGRALIVGGSSAPTAAELYDPGSDKFQATAALSGARFSHTATLLPDGRVLIAGGLSGTQPPYNPVSSAEIFDPSSNSFQPTGSLGTGRGGHAAVTLADSRILV